MSKTTRELLEDRQRELETQVAAIEAKAAPLRAERDALRAKLQPGEAKERELNAAIKALEQPELSNVKNELAAVARALGAKSMKAAAAAIEVGG